MQVAKSENRLLVLESATATTLLLSSVQYRLYSLVSTRLEIKKNKYPTGVLSLAIKGTTLGPREKGTTINLHLTSMIPKKLQLGLLE